MIDTHCHLNLPPLVSDIEHTIARANEAGVNKFIIIGTDLITSREGVNLAEKLLGAYAGVGIHPEAVPLDSQAPPLDIWAKDLKKLGSNPKVKVVGECGLDYVALHTQTSEVASRVKNLQKLLFGIHIQLAKKLNLPLSIHCRNLRRDVDPIGHDLNAYHDVFDTLEHFSKEDGVIPKFVLHCMSGDRDYLQKGLKLGGYISFAGNVTYKNAQNLRELLLATPFDRLLLETDAPFLSPEPYRGQPNEPAHVSETYRFVAQTLAVSLDTLSAKVDGNVSALFGI